MFHDVAAAWLCFLGQLEEPAPNEPKAHCEKVDDFIAYQHDERGLSASTLANQRWQVETFLEHLGVEKSSIADITVADVDAFLNVKGRGGWSRVSVATSAHALRASSAMLSVDNGVAPESPQRSTRRDCSGKKLADGPGMARCPGAP